METVIEWLPRVGAIIMVIIGTVGFFKPQAFTGNMGIEMTKPDAWSEMRTVMGALNIGYGLGALIMNSPEVYMTIGLAWLFAILARFWSILKDGMTFKGSIPAFGIDGLLAILFLSGLIF
jgi:hypothetical protein